MIPNNSSKSAPDGTSSINSCDGGDKDDGRGDDDDDCGRSGDGDGGGAPTLIFICPLTIIFINGTISLGLFTIGVPLNNITRYASMAFDATLLLIFPSLFLNSCASSTINIRPSHDIGDRTNLAVDIMVNNFIIE